MLSERKAAILQAVVEGYISTSEPVGSSQIVTSTGLDVSSATVRSEMASLEDEGYLQQPHTSAGRVPSDKGYRYFVDTLMEPYTLGRSQQHKVASFFEAAQGELEVMLKQTSGFLSRLTDYAAVVVGPGAEASPIRGVQVVRLSTDQALLVVVRANAVISKRMAPIDPDVTDTDLESCAKRLVAVYVDGHDDPVSGVGEDGLFQQLSAVVAEPEERPVFVGGTASVAGIFDAVEQVQDVLEVLEKQYLVVTLVKDVLDRGLEVAIGSETGVAPLNECSLVVSPVDIDGVSSASVALLGPTRMQYPQAMATVALVSQQLSDHLRDGDS
ncbi:MAG: heat-inducible transcriptional repressor HrcA [Acidimicrobiales bacterium]